MKPGSFDWTEILSGADWFHFTGMTPALSESLAAVCYVALEAAKARQIMVSCDLNYRKNFWSKAEAGEVMSRLMPLVDVCIANEEDAADVFGISAVETDIIQGALNKTSYAQVAQELTRRFDFKSVAITLRESVSASVNHWSAMLCHQRKSWFALKYTMSIVDTGRGLGLIWCRLDLRHASRNDATRGNPIRHSCLLPEVQHRRRFQPIQCCRSAGFDGGRRIRAGPAIGLVLVIFTRMNFVIYACQLFHSQINTNHSLPISSSRLPA